MEYLYKDKICRNFLKHYTEANYPHLLPKLIKLAILCLQNLYHKYYFTIEEIIEAIYYISIDNQSNLFIHNNNCNGNSNCNCINKQTEIRTLANDLPSPLPENQPPYPIQKLKKSGDNCGCPPTNMNNDDEIYVNVGNNFYDLNYYIPNSKSYRNKQLYSRRIVNPIFSTQSKKIYPHWWWNMKDNRCCESDDDTEEDHHPRSPKRYPKEIEDQIKKRYKSTKTIRNKIYDENKIFPNTDNYGSRWSPQRVEDGQDMLGKPNSFYMTDQNFHSTYPTQFGSNPMDNSDGYQVSGSYSYIQDNPQLGRQVDEEGVEREERV